MRTIAQSITVLLFMCYCSFVLAESTREAECKARKGLWTTGPGPRRPWVEYFCVLPATDAGKQCFSSAECSSNLCQTKGSNLPSGTKAVGECAAFNVGGCVARVQNGVIQPVVCSD